jgi:hypothetical protein
MFEHLQCQFSDIGELMHNFTFSPSLLALVYIGERNKVKSMNFLPHKDPVPWTNIKFVRRLVDLSLEFQSIPFIATFRTQIEPWMRAPAVPGGI